MDVGAIINPKTSSTEPTAAQKTAADTQDRFLKLLVAQMKHQDPMNPMDNGQVTTQMAQIQTVSGISTLNTTMQSITSQFSQMQALQSVSLVGHDVTVPGNRLQVNSGIGSASYELSGPADHVKLEILGPAGQVLDTQELGAQKTGSQHFNWTLPSTVDPSSQLSYRITATRGTTAVTSTSYCQDKVDAINTSNGKLQLQLQHLGLVDYSAVKAVD